MYTVSFFLGIIFLAGCADTRIGANQPANVASQYINAIAWNEDTIHTMHISLDKSMKFKYTFVDRRVDPVSRLTYQGKYSISGDSILLAYRRGAQPRELTQYLLQSTDGKYWIQKYTNNDRRIFLRIDYGFYR